MKSLLFICAVFVVFLLQCSNRIPLDNTTTNLAFASLSYSYGLIGVGSSSEATFTLTNKTAKQFTFNSSYGINIPFAFTGGTYPGTNATCGSTIGVSQTCTIKMTFSPQGTGSFSNSAVLVFKSGSDSIEVLKKISGDGGTPTAVLSLSGSPLLDFGSVATASSLDKSIILTNSGTLTANTVSSAILVNPFSFIGGGYPGGGSCTTVLAVGASCTINLNFNPSVAMQSTTNLTISYNNGVSSTASTSITLSGTGI